MSKKSEPAPIKMPDSGLSEAGEKEAFKTLGATSNNTASIDTASVENIQKTHSTYSDYLKEGLSSSTSKEERDDYTKKAEDAFRKASDDIRQINMRGHKTQRGIATIAGKALLAGAAAVVGAGVWLLSRK